MAWDHAVLVAHKFHQRAVSFNHRFEVCDDGEWVFQQEILVIMGGVRGEHNGAADRFNLDHLQAARMTTDAMHAHAFGHFGAAIVEDDAARIDVLHHVADMISGEGHAQRIVAHTRASGELHFGGLKMELCVGIAVQPARMIVVQVGYDNRIDRFRVHANSTDHLGRIAQDRTVTAGSLCFIVACIHDNFLADIVQNPDEVMHAVLCGWVIIKDKTVRAGAGVSIRVFNSVDFPRLGYWCIPVVNLMYTL